MQVNNQALATHKRSGTALIQPFSSANYQIMMFCGKGSFCVDFTDYDFSGYTILFLAPYQHFQWKGQGAIDIDCLEFHGDFYCIEYHKKEVACNGLLFNNVYLFPHIIVDALCYGEIAAIFAKIEKEKGQTMSFPLLF